MTEQADRTRDAVLTWLKARTKPGAHLCIDSRNIRPGDVFVALKGEHTDGLSWAPVAVARGAAAVLTEEREGEKRPVLQVPVLAVRELKKRLGEIASDFFGRPSEHMMGTAVTGTNGKTSISHWTARLLSALHHPCAAVGTMG